MRLPFVLTVFIVLCSSVAAAAPCLPGTLQDYLNLDPTGCSLEDKTLSDFSDLGSTLSPSDILVTPLPTPGSPGFTLTFGTTADPGELFESLFTFDVAVLAGGNPIGAVSASMTGSEVELSGANTALFCLGTDSPLCSPDTILLFDVGVDSLLSDSFTLGSPVAKLSVVSDIVVDGGPGPEGGAALSSVTVRFQETGVTPVPEPSFIWMPIAAGILARYLARPRR